MVVVVVVVVVEVEVDASEEALKSSSISDVMISSLRGAILRPSRLWSVFPLPNIPKIEFPAGPELLEGKSKVLVELDISFFAKYGLKYAVLKLFLVVSRQDCFQTNQF